MYAVPDATTSLIESAIVSSDSGDSRITSKYAFRATKIYDTPAEMVCNPLNPNELAKTLLANRTEERSNNCLSRKRSLAQESLERSEWLLTINAAMCELFKSFKLKADPHPIYAHGSFTMYLDSQFRITCMTIESSTDLTGICKQNPC